MNPIKPLAGKILIYTSLVFVVFGSESAYAQRNKKGPVPAPDYHSLAENFQQKSVFDSAAYYYQLSIQTSEEAEAWDRYIQSYVSLGNLYRITGKSEKAIECLQKLEENTHFIIQNKKLYYADFLHLQGTILGDKGSYHQAIELLNKTIDIRKSVNGQQDTLLAKTYNNLGTYQYYLGNLPLALKYYRQALGLESLKKKSESLDIADYYQNIGIISARMGDFEEALNFFNKNLQISSRILSPDDPMMAQIYLNLSRLYSLLGHMDEALSYNSKAQNIFIKKFGDNFRNLGTLYMNMGTIYDEKEDTKKSLEYFNNALKISEHHLNPDHPVIGSILNNIGAIHLKKRNADLALEYFEKSYHIAKDPALQAILLMNMASVYEEKQDFAEAEKKYLQAMAKSKLNSLADPLAYGKALQNYGEFCLKFRDKKKSKLYLDQALKIFQENFGERNSYVANLYRLLGQYYVSLEEYDAALNFHQKAIIANNHNYADTNYYNNPAFDNVISEASYLLSLLNKAQLFSQIYHEKGKNINNLWAGIKCYDIAIALFENIKSKIRKDSKFLLAKEISAQFAEAVERVYDLYQVEKNVEHINKAFKFAEKNKASVLLSSIKGLEAVHFGGLPENLQQREKKLQERISAYESLIYNEKQNSTSDSAKIVLWESGLFRLNQEHDSLVKFFEKQYPSYYELKYNQSVLNISEIAQKLDSTQVVLEYVLYDTSLYIFELRSTGVNFYKKNIGLEFYENLKTVRNILKIDFANHGVEDYKKYVLASYRLYRDLFPGEVKNFAGKNLVIIPDGQLGYLSFEALITELPNFERIDYRNLAYLLKQNPVSYSYSSTLLFRDQQIKSKDNKILAFAPSYQGKPVKSADLSRVQAERYSLAPLKNALIETANIVDIMKGKVYQDQQASETNFKMLAGDYDIIHLAMHTIIDDAEPMYSKLVFTNTDDTINDGLLNTYEIYGLDLKAQMAVLSACNTGSGKINEGEGIMSLARGFIYAGVPSITMTLWEIEDKSGADIMTTYYTKLKQGYKKDIALQQAKIEYIETAPQLRAHPYFWSAYVNIGKMAPLIQKAAWTKILWITLILLPLAAIIFFRTRKKSDHISSAGTSKENQGGTN